MVRDEPRLTPREQEVLAQLWYGRTNREIALALGTKRSTVKCQLCAAYEQLGVRVRGHVRTEAAVMFWAMCQRQMAADAARASA